MKHRTTARDHKSMASVNGRPRKSSGALEAEEQVLHGKCDLMNHNKQLQTWCVFGSHLKEIICRLMTGSALEAEKAVPKSMTLTFKGSGRCFDTMMLLGCKSPWISPMLASASSAVATLKIKDTSSSQNSFQENKSSWPL